MGQGSKQPYAAAIGLIQQPWQQLSPVAIAVACATTQLPSEGMVAPPQCLHRQAESAYLAMKADCLQTATCQAF